MFEGIRRDAGPDRRFGCLFLIGRSGSGSGLRFRLCFFSMALLASEWVADLVDLPERS